MLFQSSIVRINGPKARRIVVDLVRSMRDFWAKALTKLPDIRHDGSKRDQPGSDYSDQDMYGYPYTVIFRLS